MMALVPRLCRGSTVWPCNALPSVECNDTRPCLGNKLFLVMYSKLVLCTAALFVYFDSLSTSTTIPSFLKLVLCQFPKLCTVCTEPCTVAYKYCTAQYKCSSVLKRTCLHTHKTFNFNSKPLNKNKWLSGFQAALKENSHTEIIV